MRGGVLGARAGQQAAGDQPDDDGGRQQRQFDGKYQGAKTEGGTHAARSRRAARAGRPLLRNSMA
ncbi:hypothetical protein WJ971_20560 [Achromobacter xylosoxidans]